MSKDDKAILIMHIIVWIMLFFWGIIFFGFVEFEKNNLIGNLFLITALIISERMLVLKKDNYKGVLAVISKSSYICLIVLEVTMLCKLFI